MNIRWDLIFFTTIALGGLFLWLWPIYQIYSLKKRVRVVRKVTLNHAIDPRQLDAPYQTVKYVPVDVIMTITCRR
jgi:hypothetical protein